MPSLSADLEFRGLIHQVSDPALTERLDAGGLTAYIGFDPSQPSLQFGNLLQLCMLRRLQLAGHRPIVLAGRRDGHDRRSGRPERRAEPARTRRAGGQRGRHPAPARSAARLRRGGRREPGAAPRQRRVVGLDPPRRLPARRREALQREPDGRQGLRTLPPRPGRAGHLLHGVQLHAAAGLRLPPPLRGPRLPAADRRQRPVGQHRDGRRAHRAGPAAARPTRSPPRSPPRPTAPSSARA